MVIFHEPFDLNEIIKRTRIIVWLTFFICTIAWVPDGASALGAPPDSPSGQESTRSLIRQAAQAADQAWEEFHRAAIGGTLASFEILKALRRKRIGVTFLLNRESFWPLSISDHDYQKIVQRLSRRTGLTLLLEDELDSIKQEGDRLQITTRQGSSTSSCIILGSYGYAPEVSFLQPKEIQIDRGILIDENLRTSVKNVWAAGDCAQPYHHGLQDYYVNFGWPNARKQGRIAGLNLAGQPTKYDTLKVNPFAIEGVKVGTPWWQRF